MSRQSSKPMSQRAAEAFSEPFVTRSYVLCEQEKTWKLGESYLYIRPCNRSYKHMHSSFASGKSIAYVFGGQCMQAEEGESETEFRMRAAIEGMSPDFKQICDSEWKETDFIDLNTGDSLLELRRKAIEERQKKREKMKRG